MQKMQYLRWLWLEAPHVTLKYNIEFFSNSPTEYSNNVINDLDINYDMFRDCNKDTRRICVICSKLAIKSTKTICKFCPKLIFKTLEQMCLIY